MLCVVVTSGYHLLDPLRPFLGTRSSETLVVPRVPHLQGVWPSRLGLGQQIAMFLVPSSPWSDGRPLLHAPVQGRRWI